MHHLISKSVALVTAVTLVAASPSSAIAGSGAARATTLRALYGMKPPQRLVPAHTALVLVDFQDEFFHGRLPIPKGEHAVVEAARLAAWARRSAIDVVYVRNEVTRPNSPIFAAGSPTTRIVAELAPRPGELVVTKAMAGAFTRTSLDEELKARGVDTIIVAGLMTHLAVFATASDATVLGYRTIIAEDAVATRTLPEADGPGAVDAATVQRVTLAILADRVADVMPNRVLLALPIDHE